LNGEGPARPMKFLPAVLGIASGVIVAGCSTYQSRPIDSAAVNQALAPPRIESVKVAAARLRHPLIRPEIIDGTGGFTPDEIAVMAVIISPELRALRDQRGVADAQAVQAGILPNPQLAYAYDQPHGNADPTLVPGKSLGLSWDLSALLTHGAQVASAQAQATSVDLSVAWQEWQAAQAARLSAFRILSLRERLPLAGAVEEALRDSLSLTQRAVAAGDKTLLDLSAATASWNEAENTRLELEQQLTEENAALALALGFPAGDTVPLKPAAAFPELPASAAESAALLAGLEERRLDLVALRYGYESEEANLRAAVWAQFPKIGLNVNRARDTTPVKTRGYGVTVDLPLFDRNQGQIGIARATRQQLFDEYVARVAEARSQVGQILAQLTVVQRQLRAVDDSLPELERMNQAYARALTARNADLFAARDAQGSLATRQIERSQLRQQALELSVALEIATGRALLNRGGAAELSP
jgi:cobalt-zinc-cadmium efflux system outer membrane protein